MPRMRALIIAVVIPVWTVIVAVWIENPIVPPEFSCAVTLALVWLLAPRNANDGDDEHTLTPPNTDLRLAYRRSDVPSVSELWRLERMRAG